MIRRTFRHLVHVLGGLGAGLAILMAFAGWMLSSGPISLGFLTGTIERALNAPARAFTIRLDDTVLTWAGWERTLDIRVVGVRILAPDGRLVASVPELSLSLSARALVQGEIAPRRIELFQPRLRLARTADGTLKFGFDDNQAGTGAVFERALAVLRGPAGEGGELSYLNRLSIADATLAIDDEVTGTAWRAPRTRLDFSRDEGGIRADIDLDLIVDQGRTARLKVTGRYDAARDALDADVHFAGLVPAEFAKLSERVAPLSALRLPLDGTISVSMGTDGAVHAVGFDLTAGAGGVVLPDPARQTVNLTRAAFRGRYADQRLDIDSLLLDLGEKGEVLIPAPASHRMPMRGLRMTGSYDLGRDLLEIVDITADMRGPTLGVTGSVADPRGAPVVNARVTLRDVHTDTLTTYWPAAWGRDAHAWVTAHMSRGRVTAGFANLDLAASPGGGIEQFSISGELDVEGVTVDYLAPMPKATGVSGKASFDETGFRIAARTGRVMGLSLASGQLDFTGLSEVDQFADLDLNIEGPFAEAMRLIESKPLQFASKLGLDPRRAAGTQRTRLRLKFPLEKKLSIDGVDVTATARLSGVAIDGLKAGLSIGNGRLDLTVDKKGMDVTGDVDLQGLPGHLRWRENFVPVAGLLSRHVIDMEADAARLAEAFRLGFPPFDGKRIAGPLAGRATYTLREGGTGELEVDADLTKARLDLPDLRWAKVPGARGRARVVAHVEGDEIRRLPEVTLEAPDLRLNGSAIFNPGNALARFDIGGLRLGASDLRGFIVPGREGGWNLTLRGPLLDAEPFLNLTGEGAAHEDDPGPALDLILAVDRVRLGPDRFLDVVSGTLSRSGGTWRRAILDARAGAEGHAVAVRLEPGADGNRRLRVQADDAGSFLAVLGYYEYMRGGLLQLEGVYDDQRADPPLRGSLQVRDYRIIRAPGFAKLLGILSLTGIFDALQGEGVGFSILSVPFTLDGGVMEIKDARASGLSVGYTANGRVYLDADVLDIEGTLVPAYALNSALGRLPLIGGLFSGGQEGGGVFAASFRMQGASDDPTITVNPLSALTPGFLRGLFDVFDRPSPPPPARAPAGPPSPPVPAGG